MSIISPYNFQVKFLSVMFRHFASYGMVASFPDDPSRFPSSVFTSFCSPLTHLTGVVCCFCSVVKSCPTLCDPTECSNPGFPVLHYLPESAQTHVHWISDAIQPSHPLSSLSPSAPSLFQHQGLFHWVGSSYQVAKVLELQHQTFQWVFSLDFL